MNLNTEELEAGLPEILDSPKDIGSLRLIVQRPEVNQRCEVERATLSIEEGLVGDNWKARGSRMTPDGSAHPEMQLNIMNSRVVALLARDPSRWALAGDQLYVDLDLSGDNLPPGTHLKIGSVVIEVTGIPHTGCKKFVRRFGTDAMLFVNGRTGKRLNLRGINAKVVQPGSIKVNDKVQVCRPGS